MAEAPLLNNRYQLLQAFGTGGMAVVYRAHDLMLERTVAIKILREDFSRDAAFRERFRQEAKGCCKPISPQYRHRARFWVGYRVACSSSWNMSQAPI